MNFDHLKVVVSPFAQRTGERVCTEGSLSYPENMKESNATESVGQETHATAGPETGGTRRRSGHIPSEKSRFWP